MLFMRSLPEGCSFSIISFGSHYKPLRMGSVLDYNDQSKDASIAEINEFGASFGGTNILNPLKEAQLQYNAGKKKRIFLLTDG